MRRHTPGPSTRRARQLETAVTADATDLAGRLKQAWDAQRQPARQAAQIVQQGNRRVGQRHVSVRYARQELEQWAAAWHAILPAMPADLDEVLRFADRHGDAPAITPTSTTTRAAPPNTPTPKAHRTGRSRAYPDSFRSVRDHIDSRRLGSEASQSVALRGQVLFLGRDAGLTDE
jgi:hypothetical protein